ncbi:MAG: divergent polysaccharide deacetylase family protein [Proteobacteria bacterium]|nr:divergent polysaccharide deacetylase family protein [Pseudomonadota bacterium]
MAPAPQGAALPLTLPAAGRPDQGIAAAPGDEADLGAALAPADRPEVPPGPRPPGEAAATAIEEAAEPAPEPAPEIAPDPPAALGEGASPVVAARTAEPALGAAPEAKAVAPAPVSAPESAAPETAVPESATPETAVPESATPETATPETETLETATLETETPAPPAPEVAAPAAAEPPTPSIALAPTWLAYARPFDAPKDRPRIAIVVTGLGPGEAATAAAIRLPSGVTLAFVSHARDLQAWIDRARAAGHEVLLDVPMEPIGFPRIDPGPHALLTSLSGAENVDRLKWHLGRAIGYVGVTHDMGARFTTSAVALRPVLSALRVRGLMFLDSRTARDSVAARLATTIGLARAINDRFLDDRAARGDIDRRLGEVERIARETGYSVAIGHAYPVTLERLDLWLATFDEKRLALAPISAVANRQAVR